MGSVNINCLSTLKKKEFRGEFKGKRVGRKEGTRNQYIRLWSDRLYDVE